VVVVNLIADFRANSQKPVLDIQDVPFRLSNRGCLRGRGCQAFRECCPFLIERSHRFCRGFRADGKPAFPLFQRANQVKIPIRIIPKRESAPEDCGLKTVDDRPARGASITMGAVYDEFQRELADVKKTCAGDPRRELIQLFLLALEREELVSIGYRESLMQQRIAAMPVADDVKILLRHALVWIWKDEEMHTIYIRGAILKLGGWKLRAQAFLTQAAGGIGGWAGSVLQHSRWRRAPFSRLLATFVTAIGGMVGKVPKDVKQHLQIGPFRNFCNFNIDAELTAAVCWYRIAELAESQPDLDKQLARDFKRVAEDEDRHCKVFEILTAALTDEDILAEATTVESLIEQIRTVGEEFLPRPQRQILNTENPIGSGQHVLVLRA
jgi:hypothetical protein